MSVLETLAAQAPAADTHQAGATRPTGGSNGQRRSRLLVEEYLRDHDIAFTIKRQADRTIYKVPCPFNSTHGGNGESAVIQRSDGMVCFECMHKSCKGVFRWADYRDRVGKPDPQRHYDPPLSPGRGNAAAGPKQSLPPIAEGTVVRADDRGNFGTVLADNGDTCTVHFRSPEGQEAVKELPKSSLRNQDGSPIGEDSDAPPVVFEGLTLPELADHDCSVEFLVEGVFVANFPTIIGAAHKTLKTLVACDLAVSLATGLPFLGKFRVTRQARTCFMSGEGGFVVLKEYLTRICEAKGLTLRDVPGVQVFEQVPKFDRPEQLKGLREALEAHEAEVFIGDPTYMCMSGADAGNVFSMGERLDALLNACRGQATPIILHHIRQNRPDRSAMPTLEDLAWAGFSQFAGQWLMLGRQKPYDAADPGHHELAMEIGGRAGQSGKWGLEIEEGTLAEGRYWRVDVSQWVEVIEERKVTKQSKARDEREQFKRQILETLGKHPKGLHPKKISSDIKGLSKERCEVLCEEMADEEILIRCALPVSNQKTPRDGAFRVPPDWDKD